MTKKLELTKLKSQFIRSQLSPSGWRIRSEHIMRRSVFYFGVIAAAAVVASFLLVSRTECEPTASRTDCSYSEEMAAPRGALDITDVSVFDAAREEYGAVWRVEDGLARKVTYLGEDILHMRISPSKKLVGFYHNAPADERAGKDVVLEIMGIETKNVTAAYVGDYKTSDWDWIDDSRVIVYYNCGSTCHSFTIMSTKGEALYGPRMFGLSYELSPDKKWLLGYVNWNQTLGAAVMNIETKKEREFIQPRIPNRGYAAYARAAWSADSRKLAVLNKQPASEHAEAIVYDVDNDFRALYRETVTCKIIDDGVRCDTGDNGLEQFLASVLDRAGE